MSDNKKIKILRMLADSLEIFRPDLADVFICPVCFKEIPIAQKSKISEAHIIPKAAKGTLKTYLCVTCNNTFGTKQDKWFGEFLNIQNKGSIFTRSNKTRSFEIDGIKINGNYHEDENKIINFLIYADRNPPDVMKKLEERHGRYPSSMNVKVSFPILKNQHMINVGFLTAGYLMWFGVLGYSWIFQDHLNEVRKQILNPEKEIIAVNYLASSDHFEMPPWVGMMPIANIMVPVMGFNNYVVIFPPFCHPQLYESMKNNSFNISMSSIRKIGLGPEPTYGPAQSILCDQDLIVFPIMKAKKKDCHQVLWFREGEQNVTILNPISDEDFERQSKLPNAIKMSIKGQKDLKPL